MVALVLGNLPKITCIFKCSCILLTVHDLSTVGLEGMNNVDICAELNYESYDSSRII